MGLNNEWRHLWLENENCSLLADAVVGTESVRGGRNVSGVPTATLSGLAVGPQLQTTHTASLLRQTTSR